MAMTPLALSLLGVESVNRRRGQIQEEEEPSSPEAIQQTNRPRPSRPSKKPTSYYNSFQTICTAATDNPPSYEVAIRHPPLRQPPGYGKEALPEYTCTVSAQARVLLQYEAISPLHSPGDSEWREVWMVIRGTLLSFHRPKDNGPGKPLISYTLQHAEVGLALDMQHTVLVPRTRLASLIPSSARRKAWKKDSDLFDPVPQHILRLRAETDQVVISHSSEEQIHSLINAVSAGIDIAHAIDERSIPRQCTVPRRRRRQPRAPQTDDFNDPILLAEQERILRDMYPGFAERASQTSPELERTTTNTTERSQSEVVQIPTREEDELDLAVIREDFAAPSEPAPTQPTDSSIRPSPTRQATSSSFASAYSADTIYATAPTNFDSSGKWQPPHTRTPQQVQRYIRRCMPVLAADAFRASDVLICHGTRVKINWRMELMESWELSPPTYKSHRFDHGAHMERVRSCSQNSATRSTTHDNSQTAGSDAGGEGEEEITRAESELANLDLSKVTAVNSSGKASPCDTKAPKPQHTRHSGADIHGVVLCF